MTRGFDDYARQASTQVDFAQLGAKAGPSITIDRVENGWLVHYEDKGQQFVFLRVADMVAHVNRTYGHMDIDADAPELPFDKAINAGEVFAHRSAEAETDVKDWGGYSVLIPDELAHNDAQGPTHGFLTPLEDARGQIILNKPGSAHVLREELSRYGVARLVELSTRDRDTVLSRCEERLGIDTNTAWPTKPSPEDKEED